MHNYTKLLAFTFAFGSMALFTQFNVYANDKEPVVEIQDTEIMNEENTDSDESNEKEDVFASDGNISIYTDEEINNIAEDVNEMATSGGTLSDDQCKLIYQVESDDSASDKLITVNETFTTKNTKETLMLIGNAITEQNEESLMNVLKECYKESAGTDMADTIPVKLINDDFIDTNKWSIFPKYDAEHCWAEAAANVLWITGWAQSAINPLTNDYFKSVDEVAVYFSTYFTDEGGFSYQAYNWFFDGNYYSDPFNEKDSQLTKDSSENKYKSENYGLGTDQSGLLTDYCVTPLIKEVTFNEQNLNEISLLENLGTNLSTEISIETLMTVKSTGEVLKGNLHSMTVVGMIINPNDTTLNRYKALLISDSDNDTNRNLYGLPNNASDVITTKQSLTRSYTLYYLNQYTNDGKVYWELINFSRSTPETESHTIVEGFESLEMKTSSSIQKATETNRNASKDTSTTTDLVLKSVTVSKLFDETTTSFNVGDTFNLSYTIENGSKKDYISSMENPTNNRIEIYKNGNLIETVNFDLTLYQYSHTSGQYYYNLSDYVQLKPGSYTLKLTVNANEKYKEAYYLNNTFDSVQFTILGDEEEDSQDKKEASTNIDRSVNQETVYNSSNMVDTGIYTLTGFFTTMLVTSFGAILVLLKK